MREIIAIHLGQCGVQVGSACWELFCAEHGIKPDGSLESNNEQNEHVETFFHESVAGTFVPRSCFVDLEPSVVDAIRVERYGKLYNPDHMLSAKEDASSCHPRGNYTVGRDMLGTCMKSISKLVEQCSSLQGFILFRSLGGGTGSGFGSNLLSRLSDEYGKKLKFDFCVFPSPRLATNIVEPYNVTLSMRDIIEYSNVAFVLDNEAMYNICERSLNITPTYKDINRLIAQAVSSLTASLRFGGPLNVNLSDFQTNLIPFPRINFLLTSYAPLIPTEKQFHEKLSVAEITNAAFDPKNVMASCNPQQGKYIACCLLYRGDVMPREVLTAVSHIKSQGATQFVDWCPTGFKCGINEQAPAHIADWEAAKVNRALCMISNTTAFSAILRTISTKFDVMYAKRAFAHWFVGEGMESGEFCEARETLGIAQKDYEEL